MVHLWMMSNRYIPNHFQLEAFRAKTKRFDGASPQDSSVTRVGVADGDVTLATYLNTLSGHGCGLWRCSEPW